MMEAADLHNFGKSVQRIGHEAGFVYLKPRPIFWEGLFFGRNSPLSFFFANSRLGGFTPRDVLFNLVTESENDFSGRSEEVVTDSSSENLPSHLYSLGVLLAYCYIFGIRDLHRGNVIRTSTHLQVVDAEVVLSRLLLPHETLLLPFKEVGKDQCGISKVLDLCGNASPDEIATVLMGYLDTFENILRNREGILNTLEKLESKMCRIPIRHILRDTFHYRDAKINTPDVPFFASECVQLDRGDIPYYFKYMGAESVLELTDEQWSHEIVNIPEVFKKGAAREAQDFRTLLDANRIREHLFPAGLLYISKILFQSYGLSKVFKSGLQVELQGQNLSANTPMGLFSAPIK